VREKALHELDFDARGFEWVDCHDWPNSILAFLRRGSSPDDLLLVCCNFTPVPRHGYRVGVPVGGMWDEVFNGDSSWYGGSNVGNAGSLAAQPGHHHGHVQSLSLSLPPLATIVLKPRRA
jgi:1,4-alpha-glucan branching enzyme